MKIHPYLNYKPSRAAWLGDIPTHWEVVRLKGHAANVVDVTKELDLDAIYLALEHVESWTGRYVAAGDDVDFDSQVKRFRPWDVLFGKLRPYLAKVACPDRNGVCAGEFLVLRPRLADLQPRYLESQLRTKPVIDTIDASTFGAKMPRADWRFIGDMQIALPPLDEQCAIVRYLDFVDRSILRYVRAKQKLLRLLEEQKQTVIHQAVTGQIDVRTGKPYTAYKPSGVEWLENVPEHWEVRRLRTLVVNVVEQTHEQRAHEPYLALENVESWTGRYRSAGPGMVFDSKVKRFQEGDVLFGKLRPYLAKVARPREDGVCVGEFLVLRSNESGLLSTYLEGFLRSRSVIHAINKSTFGAKMPRVDWQFIGDLKQYVPPLSEQIVIVEYLDKLTNDIDSAVTRTKHQIELLREYQTRLATDVVTGKLDVRETAAELSEEDYPGDAEESAEAYPTEKEVAV